jgi:hypothetical protein
MAEPLLPEAQDAASPPQSSPRLVRIISWNLWLIPNSSHELGPRPIKQAERLGQLMHEARGGGRDDGQAAAGLEVVCMQETWAWHAGCFKLLFACTAWLPLGLRPALRDLSTKFDVLCDVLGFIALLLALLAGIVFRLLWFLPGYEYLACWNPRRLLIPHLRAAGLTHVVGATPCFTEPALFDSGLFMVANQAPKTSGHISFTNTSWATEERFANKGLQWAFFSQSDIYGTLVVNLHGRCASALEGGDSVCQVDGEFVDELCARLKALATDFSTAAETVEMYVAGDWNIPQSSEFWRQVLAETGLDDVSQSLAGHASMVNTHAVDLDSTLDLIAAKRWQGGEPQSLADEWECSQAIEERPAGATLPPPGTHGQWQYLGLRDALSDHHAVVAARK